MARGARLETLVRRSVRAADWLTDADAAAVGAAVALARLMDAEPTAAGFRELHRLLEGLGLTLAGRSGRVEAPRSVEADGLARFRKPA